MEQELRRALLHGFTQTEVDEAKARYINAAEQAVKRAPTRESAGLAMGFIGSIGKKSVFTTPDTSLELVKKGLAKLTPTDCHKAFQKFWDTTDLSFRSHQSKGRRRHHR
jgi:zinc protease